MLTLIQKQFTLKLDILFNPESSFVLLMNYRFYYSKYFKILICIYFHSVLLLYYLVA